MHQNDAEATLLHSKMTLADVREVLGKSRACVQQKGGKLSSYEFSLKNGSTMLVGFRSGKVVSTFIIPTAAEPPVSPAPARSHQPIEDSMAGLLFCF